MVDASKVQELIRTSLQNAAIYGAIAELTDAPERARDFKRLQEIQTAIARQLSNSVSSGAAVGRFSVSLMLFKLATRVFSSARVAGFLRSRFRQNLSASGEDYLRTGLRNEAAESMELLDRLRKKRHPTVNIMNTDHWLHDRVRCGPRYSALTTDLYQTRL